jgi:hypothetical protein
MDARLVKLLLIRFKGGVRQRFRELKTPRGMLFLGATLTVMTVLMADPGAMAGNPLQGVFSRDPAQLREQIAQFMPVGLLAGFLLTICISPSPGLYFSPAEVDLLFSGPFTRRSLLLYKLGSYAFGVLLSSALVTLLLPSSALAPAPAFLGTFLTLLFLQLLTVVSALLGQWPGKRAWARLKGRRAVIALIVLLAAAGAYSVDFSGGLAGALTRFQESFTGALLLAPFNVFTRIFLAASVFPDLFAWTALGLALNFGLVAAVIRLDRYASEASTAASLELHRRWDRARCGGALWGGQLDVVRSSSRPPGLGGIGPLAWRQLLSAGRSAGKALVTFLVVAAAAGPLLVKASAEFSPWSVAGAVFVAAVFVLPRTLVFDFRSDLETLESFKALPLPAWKICLGQLAAPVLLTSLIEGVLLISAANAVDGQARLILIGLGLFLLPFNMLLYEAENLFFLLFPAPLVPVGRADFDFMGRTLAGYALTAVFLVIGSLLAAGSGYRVAQAAGLGWSAFLIIAWLVLSLIAMMGVPLLGWAFRQFDVARDR